MYFDPKIYNYSNLTKEDRRIIDYMMDFTLSSIDAMYNDYDMELRVNDNILNSIRFEERIIALKEVYENFIGNVIDLMVSMIDNYPDEIEIDERDTNDHFFGYSWPDYIDDIQDIEGLDTNF